MTDPGPLACSTRNCKRTAIAWQYSYTTKPRIVCGTHTRDNENNWSVSFVPKEES